MNAIPYDRPEEEWDQYQEGNEEFALPGRPRRQWFNKKTAALFAVLLAAIGFYAGVRVEKNQLSNSSSATGAAGGGAAALRAAAAARGGATGATGATGAAGASGSGAAARTGAGAGAGGFRALFGGGGAAGGAGATFGTVSSISGDNLYITEATGNTVKVTLSSATKVTKNVGVGKNAVRPGDTVVVAGAKNSDGAVSATTLSDTGAGLASGSGSGSGGSSSTSGSSAVNSLFGSGGGG